MLARLPAVPMPVDHLGFALGCSLDMLAEGLLGAPQGKTTHSANREGSDEIMTRVEGIATARTNQGAITARRNQGGSDGRR